MVRAGPWTKRGAARGTAVTARPAVSLDADAIGAIHAASWRTAYVDQFPPRDLERAAMARATQWTADRVLDKGSQGGVLLVAVAGDEVRGFGYGVPGEVVGFYVDPRSWGSGLAAVLLTALVGALGEGPVLLWTLAGSTQARRFYEKNDWVLTGRRRDVELVAGCAREVLEYSLRP